MKLETLVVNEEQLKVLSTLPLADTQKAWDLSIALDTAFGHIKKFGEKRDALIQRLGDPVKDKPDQFQVSEDKFAEFSKELDKLTSVDVKCSFPKVTMEMLKGAEVSAGNISAWREVGILIKK